MANITRTSQIDQTARGMLGEAPKDGDLVLIKDVSDATSGGGGRDKYVTVSNLVKSVGSVSGLAGSPGVQGPRGPQGPKGDKGDQGIQGLNGLSGQDGARGPQGIQGQRGAPGPTGISPAGLAWQGTWASGRSYEVNDTVAYEGASYFCITGNSGTTPPDQSANFALLAAQGADGAPGADGADGAAGVQGPRGNQGEVGPQGPAGPAGADGIQGVDGSEGAQGPKGDDGAPGATVFTELDQIPDTLDPGAYLRVNKTGDGLINVNQAPPDGGVRSIPQINARNKTGLPIPDYVFFLWDGRVYRLPFLTITETEIFYTIDVADNDYMRVRFKNDTDGPNSGSNVSRYYGNARSDSPQNSRDPRTYQYSLKQYIDPTSRPDPTDTDKLVIYEGQQSGTSGLGRLTPLVEKAAKTLSGGFYTELPDAIYSQGANYDGVFRLHWVKPDTSSATGSTWEIIYRAEAFQGPQDYWIGFRLDQNGTNVTASSTKATGISKTQNLRWFIENGRAIYYNANLNGSSNVNAGGSVNDITGLIRHYNLDGNLDDVTNTAHLTSTGDALSYESGKYNQAVKLNGTNNKLRTELVMPATSSISLWYKHNDEGSNSNNSYLFGDFAGSGGNATSSVSLLIKKLSNKIAILTSGGDQFDSPSSHSEWHHVVLARSGSAWKFYLDGSEVHSGTSATAVNKIALGFWTSANQTAPNFFGGWLDNIRIYSKELTASEVTTLYNQ